MPNRRCPFTPDMMDTALAEPSNRPNTLNSSLNDWFILCLFLGPRKSEWCQDASELKKIATFARNMDGSSKAFIIHDFKFLGHKNKVLSALDAAYLKNIHAVRIRW